MGRILKLMWPVFCNVISSILTFVEKNVYSESRLSATFHSLFLEEINMAAFFNLCTILYLLLELKIISRGQGEEHFL